MAYTTIKKPSDYFNTILYTGDGTGTQSQTGVGFEPDMVWVKSRNAANYHGIADQVRGVDKFIYPNDNLAEQTNATDYLNSFDSDGFTHGLNGTIGQNSVNYASWNWKANGAGSANTDGSINSTVSANTTSGFSIVKYTGNGSDQTVGHGLGVAPSLIIVKCLTTAHDWVVYHSSLGNGSAIALNLTNAEYSATAWQNTSPTNQVFYIKGGANSVSQSGDFIAYCFAEKQGFSKFGTYKGTTPFVYTGFKPAVVIMKTVDTILENWNIMDNKRDSYNSSGSHALIPSTTAVEYANNSGWQTDFLSNGFKINGSQSSINYANTTYLYMAFAEEPLVGDNPATAR